MSPLNEDWIVNLAEENRGVEEDARRARERMERRKAELASAASKMMRHLRELFEKAAAVFNRTSPSVPVSIAPLKGSGFSVTRGERRLTVLKTADWNVAFSFAVPPKVDMIVLLSRIEDEQIGWRLCRSVDEKEKLEMVPTEGNDVASLVTSELFAQMIDAKASWSVRSHGGGRRWRRRPR